MFDQIPHASHSLAFQDRFTPNFSILLTDSEVKEKHCNFFFLRGRHSDWSGIRFKLDGHKFLPIRANYNHHCPVLCKSSTAGHSGSGPPRQQTPEALWRRPVVLGESAAVHPSNPASSKVGAPPLTLSETSHRCFIHLRSEIFRGQVSKSTLLCLTIPAKQPHMIILPPLCLTVALRCFCWNAAWLSANKALGIQVK